MSERNNEVLLDDEQSTVNIKDLFYLCLGKWYWFAVSVFLCIGIAALYLIHAEPVYTRSASVLIKDDDKGKSVSSAMDGFSDLGLFSSSKNVVDEIGAMQSRDVFTEVVRRLHLDVSYTEKAVLGSKTLYGEDLPISVSLPELQESFLSFKIELLGGGKFKLRELCGEEEKFSETFNGVLGESLTTPIGVIAINPSAFYTGTEKGEIRVVKRPEYKVVDGYTKTISIARGDKESNIINLSIKDNSIKRGDDILNTLLAVYNEYWIEDKNKITVSTSQFINSRLGIIESELGDVDNDISSYKSANKIPDLEEVAKLYLDQVKESNLALQELNDKAYMAQYILTQLSTDANKFQPLPANSGLGKDNGITDQIKSYNEKVIDRGSLVARSSTSNPIVVELDKALAQMRQALVTSIENEQVAINSQIKSQQDISRKVNSEIASTPNQAKYLISVERQQKVKESLYLYLLQKREENELSQAFIAYNTRILTSPGGSMKATAPIKRNILLVAFMLGLLIPLGIIFMQETLNTKVRSRKDLEEIKAPLVGEIPGVYFEQAKSKIPFHKKKVSRVNTIVVKEGNRDIVNEAFRVLRTNLEFMVGRREGHKTEVIMCTSFNPGSGKSFVVMNEAVALAIRSIKVLVVDGDLRHASTSAYVFSPAKGLSDYLSGRIDDVHKVIVNDEKHKYLDVLPVGTIPPNPSELLLSEKLGEALEALKSEYDYIFVDCPPIEMFADTQIVSKLSDRTLFVVRAGLLEKSMLPELDNLYNEKKYPNMSVILNGTEATTGHYGYRYGYKYGYGYGSYYGSDGKHTGGGNKWLDNN